jgi:hypothetical protein
MATFQVVIGRLEKIDVDGIASDIPAKVDTGAYRSAIHATDIKVEKVDGELQLSCKLLGHPVAPEPKDFITKEFGQVNVRNSFGHEEDRYEVTLKVKVGPKKFKTSFTLADRSSNVFPVLIGRKLLRKRFLVDVDRTNVDRKKILKEVINDAHIDKEKEEVE